MIEVGDGVVSTYMHNTVKPGLGKIGVLVGLESTGDKEQLDALGKQLAMHVAAAASKALPPSARIRAPARAAASGSAATAPMSLSICVPSIMRRSSLSVPGPCDASAAHAVHRHSPT